MRKHSKSTQWLLGDLPLCPRTGYMEMRVRRGRGGGERKVGWFSRHMRFRTATNLD